MKFTVTKKNLLDILQRCAPIAKLKGPMPVLSCVLLKADMQLTGTATDLYQCVVARTSIDPDKPGEVAVNAKDILARVQTFPEGPLTLSADEKHLTVSAGKRKHKIPIVDAGEFPKIAPVDPAGVTIPGKLLAKVLEQAAPAARTDPGRAEQHSVCFELKDGIMSAIATDGSHAHMATTEHPGSIPSGMIPIPSVHAILSILDKSTDAVLSSGPTGLSIRSGTTVYTTKQVSGTFPPVREYLRETPAHRVEVQSEALQGALRSAALASDAKLINILTLRFTPASLAISANGAGEAEDELPHPCPTDLTVSLDAALLLSALTSSGHDTPTIAYGSDDLSPLLILAPGFRGLVMPCRR